MQNKDIIQMQGHIHPQQKSTSSQHKVKSQEAQHLESQESIQNLHTQNKESQQAQIQLIPKTQKIGDIQLSKSIHQDLRIKLQKLKLKFVLGMMQREAPSFILNQLTQKHFQQINDQSYFLRLDSGILKFNNKLRLNRRSSLYIQSQEDQLQQNSNSKCLQLISDCLKRLQQIFIQIPAISPASFFKMAWDILFLFIIIIYLVLIPIHLAFQMPFSILISNEIANIAPIIFIVDIIINLNTGYYDKGIAIVDKWKIVKNYIEHNLITDIVAVLPNIIYHYMTYGQEAAAEYVPATRKSEIEIQYFAKFFLMFFYMKLNCFSDITKRLEELSHLKKKTSLIIQLIKLVFTILIIAHMIACLWILVGIIQIRRGSNNWMTHIEIQDAPWQDQYIRALYFSIVTMITIGYGDILPMTNAEMALDSFLMIFSCGVYAYTFNEVGSIFSKFGATKQKLKDNMAVINMFMYKKQVNSELQFQVREYLEYYWKESIDRDQELEKQILLQLSDQLREQLLIEANKIVLKDSPIFNKNFSKSVIQKTIPLIQEYKCNPGEIIVKQDTIIESSIYFIQKGEIQMYINKHTPGQPDSAIVIKTIKEGQYFCAEEFFTDRVSQINYRSKDFSTLLFISRKDFINILQDFPEDYEQFCSIKDNLIFNNNYEQIEQECSLCSKLKQEPIDSKDQTLISSIWPPIQYKAHRHTEIDCPLIHCRINKQKTITIYQMHNLLNRDNSFQRGNLFPKAKYCSLKNREIVFNITQEYLEENDETIEQFRKIYLSNDYVTEQIDHDDDNLIDDQKIILENPNSNTSIQEDQMLQQQQQKEQQLLAASNTEFLIQDNNNILKQTQDQEVISSKTSSMQEIKEGINQIDVINQKQLTAADSQQQQKSMTDVQQKRQISRQNSQFNNILQGRNQDCQRSKRQKTMYTKNKYKSFALPTKQKQFNIQKNQMQQQQELLRMIKQELSNQGPYLGNRNQDLLDVPNNLVGHNGVFAANNNKNDDQFNDYYEFCQQFESMKNYIIYMPYNNINYQLLIMNQVQIHRGFLCQRTYLDNILHNRKILKIKCKYAKEGDDYLRQEMKKFTQEKQNHEVNFNFNKIGNILKQKQMIIHSLNHFNQLGLKKKLKNQEKQRNNIDVGQMLSKFTIQNQSGKGGDSSPQANKQIYTDKSQDPKMFPTQMNDIIIMDQDIGGNDQQSEGIIARPSYEQDNKKLKQPTQHRQSKMKNNLLMNQSQHHNQNKKSEFSKEEEEDEESDAKFNKFLENIN